MPSFPFTSTQYTHTTNSLTLILCPPSYDMELLKRSALKVPPENHSSAIGKSTDAIVRGGTRTVTEGLSTPSL